MLTAAAVPRKAVSELAPSTGVSAGTPPRETAVRGHSLEASAARLAAVRDGR